MSNYETLPMESGRNNRAHDKDDERTQYTNFTKNSNPNFELSKSRGRGNKIKPENE